MVVTAAAAEEEELRHMGPTSRAKQVEQADIAAAEQGVGEEDDEILRFMDSADGFLLLMDSLSSALRQSSPHFTLSKWCMPEESNSSDAVSAQDSTDPKLRYRGAAANPDGSTESDATIAKSSTGVDGSSQVQKARSKALSIFGTLVSPKLRTTQVSFETALELIVELANSRSTMLSSFSQIKHESGVSA